jgi:flagellar biosynthesis/type III secretory pathway M-ring protein FliF/YscJ
MEVEMFTAIFWKKAWIWLKHHWYWPVIIALIIFSLVSGPRTREKLFGLLTKQKENYEKELQIIKETAEEADKKKSEIFTDHIKELEKIEQEHDIKIEELEEEKQKELAEVIRENKKSPDKLAKEIARILSAEYLKKNR